MSSGVFEVPKEKYIRTTIYLRPDLYAKMRELGINFSEWVNENLEIVINGSNEQLTDLLNKERKLKAELAGTRQQIQTIEVGSIQQQHEQAKIDYEQTKEVKRRDELAHHITKMKPSFFVSGRRFEKYTTAELEDIVKELIQKQLGDTPTAPPRRVEGG